MFNKFDPSSSEKPETQAAEQAPYRDLQREAIAQRRKESDERLERLGLAYLINRGRSLPTP
jgi:hypothetical protein